MLGPKFEIILLVLWSCGVVRDCGLRFLRPRLRCGGFRWGGRVVADVTWRLVFAIGLAPVLTIGC